jgi:hypothetical protein
MLTKITGALILFLGTAASVDAGVVTLEDTIPSAPLSFQPAVLTGAALFYNGGGPCTLQTPCFDGLDVADAFTPTVSANLYQISVAVDYEDPGLGVMGTAPMLLTLFSDSGDSPGTEIESWTVPMSPSDTSLTVITVTSVAGPLLNAGQQYWLSVVPTDPVATGIGWGLASPGYPGIELPVAYNDWDGNYGWNPTELNIANEFSVTGTNSTVPEPATFGISALVLCALGAVNWRKAFPPCR